MSDKNSENNEKKKKKGRRLPVVSIVLGVILGIALGFASEKLPFISAIFEMKFTDLLLVCLSVIPAYFIHIAVHETGHLVFGLISGYKFSSFRFFTLLLYKKDGRLRVGTLSVPGTAGQCLMIPPEMHDGKIPVLSYNLGGIVFNLILTALTAALTVVFRDLPMVAGIMLLSTVVGLIVSLVNGIPNKNAFLPNDGRNAFSLGKDPAAMKAFYTQMNVVAAITSGTRLRDMPSEWFYLPSMSEMKNGLVVSMSTLMFSRLIDVKKYEEAREFAIFLLEADSGLSGIQRGVLLMEGLFLDLLLVKEQDCVREKLDAPEMQSIMKIMEHSPSAKRLEYAIELLYEKDEAAASKSLAEFEKLSKKYPYKQEIDGERELIEAIKAKHETINSDA